MNFLKFSKTKNISLTAVILIVGVFLGGLAVGKSQNEVNLNTDNNSNLALAEFWHVWQELDKRFPFAEKPSDQEKLWSAIEGLARSYNDPYTSYLNPEDTVEFNHDIYDSEFSGVGMEIGIREEVLTVISPLRNTPADRSGILPGDIIFKIDDIFSAELSIDEAVDMIRGPRGTTVNLTIIREGEFEPLLISVIRDTIEIPILDSYSKKDIFVIELYSFTGDIKKDFFDAMTKFSESGHHKLILDLRSNPGGFLESAVDVSSWFLPQGLVVVEQNFGKENQEENIIHRSKGLNIGRFLEQPLKMVILVNEGSASAAEIVAGALQEHGVATLIGQQTFGKGSVQELVDLSGGGSLKITVAKWLTPNGRSISEEGLKPDVVVELTREDYINGEDPQFAKALELLK